MKTIVTLIAIAFLWLGVINTGMINIAVTIVYSANLSRLLKL